MIHEFQQLKAEMLEFREQFAKLLEEKSGVKKGEGTRGGVGKGRQVGKSCFVSSAGRSDRGESARTCCSRQELPRVWGALGEAGEFLRPSVGAGMPAKGT
ncbi:MAG: hypothetical protein H5U02_01310 [Clostridia bacterium]|nr:hypothetical protein [Clostridia bacterium]